MNQKPKKTTAYAMNKKAFDDVLICFRRTSPLLGPPGAMNLKKAGGSPTPKNPIAPLPVEFRSDVLLAVQASIPKGVSLRNFILSYLLFDSDDEIERGVFAQKILGGRALSVEQRVGAEFVRRAIYPLGPYMFPPRMNSKS